MDPRAAIFLPPQLNSHIVAGTHTVGAQSAGAPTVKHLDDVGAQATDHAATAHRSLCAHLQDIITALREENARDARRVPIAEFFATLHLDSDSDSDPEIHGGRARLSCLTSLGDTNLHAAHYAPQSLASHPRGPQLGSQCCRTMHSDRRYGP